MHEKAHDARIVTKRKRIVTLRAVPISSENLKLTGECDIVELVPDENGIALPEKEGKWRICPVEYKRGSPKTNEADKLQLAAQCMCLEEMLCCTINEGSLYYGQTRHRENVKITDALRSELLKNISEMQEYYKRKYTPTNTKTRWNITASKKHMIRKEV